MKTWIIILTISWVVFMLIDNGIGNVIKNDRQETLKYYFTDGGSPLGLWHVLFYLLYKLTFWADVILFIIYVLNKL